MASDVSSVVSLHAKLGRYQVVKHLARGGMADVLLARTNGIEGFARHVVLKRIRPEQARDRVYVSMFLDEARLAASLHHHNIVQVTDIGEAHGEYFFTMEYVHGEDVRSLLARVSRRDEMVPLEHVLSIVCAAAAGLHHAHEQRDDNRKLLGIVHRDVSPANILVGYDGGVKVADFGIAKSRRTAETASGTLKGKVAYMSPEQAVGEAVDRRSDVFSLGIVMYELLTARRLFKGENDFLTMTAIVLGYIPPASELRPDLPPEIEEILMKALANKPQDRYSTIDELRLALEQVAAKLQLSMTSTGLADYMKYVFGERPLPWLDTAAPIASDEIDFDGSRIGVARPPTEDPVAAGRRTRAQSLDETRDVRPSPPPRAPSPRAERQSDVHDIPELVDPVRDVSNVHDLPELPAQLVPPPVFERPESVVLLTTPRSERPDSIVLLTMPKPAMEPPTVTVRPETEIKPLRVGRTLLAFAALVGIAIAIYLVRTQATIEDMRAVVPPVESIPLPFHRPTGRAPLPTGAVVVDPPPLTTHDVKPKLRSKPQPAPPAQKPPPPTHKRWDPNALFPD